MIAFVHELALEIGAVLSKDIVIPPGPLPNATAFPSTMLDQFRKLGLVVEMDDGVITLRYLNIYFCCCFCYKVYVMQ